MEIRISVPIDTSKREPAAPPTPAELEAARRELGFSCSQMAAALETPLRVYEEREKGRRTMPGIVRVALRAVRADRSRSALAEPATGVRFEIRDQGTTEPGAVWADSFVDAVYALEGYEAEDPDSPLEIVVHYDGGPPLVLREPESSDE